jgi:selenophosphate synthetase-related protein
VPCNVTSSPLSNYSYTDKDKETLINFQNLLRNGATIVAAKDIPSGGYVPTSFPSLTGGRGSY